MSKIASAKPETRPAPVSSETAARGSAGTSPGGLSWSLPSGESLAEFALRLAFLRRRCWAQRAGAFPAGSVFGRPDDGEGVADRDRGAGGGDRRLGLAADFELDLRRSGGAGLVVHYLQKGWSGAWHSLLGALIGFGVFLVFYLLGGMGGGDVKLMSGFGALLGDGRILAAALIAAVAGGLMALGFLAVRAIFRRSRIWLGVAVPEAPATAAKSGESIPYAPAITVGAWLALVSEM